MFIKKMRNETKVSVSDQSAKKSLVLNKSTWNSLRRRSGHGIVKQKFPLEVDHQHNINYSYEKSNTIANMLEKNVDEPAKPEVEVELQEYTKRYYEINKNKLFVQSFDDIEQSRIRNVASYSCKNNRQRKQDEYKTELRQFIEDKQRQQMVQKEAECARQKLERLQFDSDLKEELKKDRIMLSKRKAARRIIELQSMYLSGKTQGKFNNPVNKLN